MANENSNLFIVNELFDTYKAALMYLDGCVGLNNEDTSKYVHEAGRCVILAYKINPEDPEKQGRLAAIDTKDGPGGNDHYYLLTPYINTVYGVFNSEQETFPSDADPDVANLVNGEVFLWNIKEGDDSHPHCKLVTKDEDEDTMKRDAIELVNAQLFIAANGEMWIVSVEEKEEVPTVEGLRYNNFCYARKLNDILTKDEIISLVQREIAALEAKLDEKYGYEGEPFASLSVVDNLESNLEDLEEQVKDLEDVVKALEANTQKDITNLNAEVNSLKSRIATLEQRINGTTPDVGGGSVVSWTQAAGDFPTVIGYLYNGEKTFAIKAPSGTGGGEPGEPGTSGHTAIPIIIFKGEKTNTRPSVPTVTSGWYDGENYTIPEGVDGWSVSNNFDDDDYVWMTSSSILTSGSQMGYLSSGWSTPILVAEPRSAIMGDKGFYTLDLSNEIDIIGLGGDLVLDVDVILNPTTVTLYDGAQKEYITKENVSVIVGEEDGGLITYELVNNEGSVDIIFTLHKGLSFKEEGSDAIKNKSVSITVTKGNYTRTKYYTLGGLKHGEEGQYFKLVTSVSAIPFKYESIEGGEKQLRPSIPSVTCQAWIGEINIDLGTEYRVYYSIGTVPSLTPSEETECPNGEFNTEVLVGEFDEEMVIFYLLKDGVLLDREGVPFIRDGRDGVDGTPGADADGVEYIYCLTDKPETHPAFPITYDDKTTLFDRAELDESYEYEGTIWYDRAQSISPEMTTVWIAGRTKVKTDTESETPVWIYTDPTIWSHWGTDGTDGDGVEYIFKSTLTRTKPNPNPTDVSSDEFVLAAIQTNDFYPGDLWFDGERKDDHKEMLRVRLEDTRGAEVTIEEVDSHWETLRSSLKNIYGDDSWGWTDDPVDPDENNRYIWASIRKYDGKTGKWGEYSTATLWNTYTENTFTAFAFAAVPSGINLSGTTPTGGSITRQWPDPMTVGDKEVVWHDAPTGVTTSDTVWMTKATISTVSTKELVWSSPIPMSDSSTFNVEWCNEVLTEEKYNQIREAFLEKDNKYNLGVIISGGFTGGSDGEDTNTKAEEEFEKRCREDFGVNFSDIAEGAVYMATCSYSNGVWSNWSFVKIKGEDGAPGTSISIKGPIKYEIIWDTDDYPESVTSEYIVDNISGTPNNGDKVIILPKSAGTDKDSIYIGDRDDRSLLVYIYDKNGLSWKPFVKESGAESGDAYITSSGHLIVFDATQNLWFDTGHLKGEDGDSYKNITKFAVEVEDEGLKSAYNNWEAEGKNPDTWETATHKVAKINVGGDYYYIQEYVQSDIFEAKFLGNCTYNTQDIVPPIYDDTSWTWVEFHGQDAYGFEVIYAKVNPEKYPDGLIRCPSEDQCKNNEVWTPNKYGYLPKCDGIQWMDDWSNDSLINDVELIEWLKNYGEISVYKCWRERQPNGLWSEYKGQLLPLEDENGEYHDRFGNTIEYAGADDANSTDTYWRISKVKEENSANIDDIVNENDIVKAQYAISISADVEKNTLKGSDEYYMALAKKPVVSSDYHINKNGTPDTNYWKLSTNDTGFGEEKPYLYKVAVNIYTYYSECEDPILIQEYTGDPTIEYSGTTRWYLKSKSGDDCGYYGQDFVEIFNKPFPDSSETGDKGIDYWTKEVISFDSTYKYLWCIEETKINDRSDYSYPFIAAQYAEGKPGKDSISFILDNPSDEISVNDNYTIKSDEELTLRTTATLWKGGTKLGIESVNDVIVYGEPTGNGIQTEKKLNSDGSVTIEITIPANSYLRSCNCTIATTYGGSIYKASYKIKTKVGGDTLMLVCNTSSIHVKYDNTIEPECVELSIKKIGESALEPVTGDSTKYKVFYSADGENWIEYVDNDGTPDGKLKISGSGLFNDVSAGGSLKLILATPKEGSAWGSSGASTPTPESGKAIYEGHVYYFVSGKWVQEGDIEIRGYFDSEEGVTKGFEDDTYIIVEGESGTYGLYKKDAAGWTQLSNNVHIAGNLPESWPITEQS